MEKDRKDKKKKKMSNKEIYRILAFEFKDQNSTNIRVSLISDMVSNLFYPNDTTGESKSQFKNLIEKAFDQYSSKATAVNKDGFQETFKEISEEQFCKAMESIEQYVNDDTTERFLQKIFKRHDKDKDDHLNKEEFNKLMQNYNDKNINQKDINEIYDRMSQGNKQGISFENFKKFSM